MHSDLIEDARLGSTFMCFNFVSRCHSTNSPEAKRHDCGCDSFQAFHHPGVDFTMPIFKPMSSALARNVWMEAVLIYDSTRMLRKTRFFLSFGFYWVRWLHCGCILNVLEKLYIQKTSSNNVRIFQISNNSSTNSSKIRLWWKIDMSILASPFHFHRQFAAERAAAFQSTCPDGSQPLIWTEQPRFSSRAMVKGTKCCTHPRNYRFEN